MRGGQSSSGDVEITTEHGQDVQMFINVQHGQIIIMTVVVEGATSQHLAFHISTAPAVSRELKTAGLGQVACPVNMSGFHNRRQKG